MKFKSIICFIAIVYWQNIFAQNIEYFDIDSTKISKDLFLKKSQGANVLAIDLNEGGAQKLVIRRESGTIKNISTLISSLESLVKKSIDTSKIIVIIYYPGKDRCNSSGDLNFVIKKNIDIDRKVKKKTQQSPFFVYKDYDGLKPYKKSINWVKDSEQIIEKTFFKYHYPCGSFTVVDKNGNYESYFGEYPLEFIMQAIEHLM